MGLPSPIGHFLHKNCTKNRPGEAYSPPPKILERVFSQKKQQAGWSEKGLSPPSFDPSGDGGTVGFLVIGKRALSFAIECTVGGAALADCPFFGNLVEQFWNSASFFVFLALVLVNDVKRSPVAIVCDLHSSAPFVVITALRVITSACFHDAEHAASAFCQSSHVFALVDSEFFKDITVRTAKNALFEPSQLVFRLFQENGRLLLLRANLGQFCILLGYLVLERGYQAMIVR